MGADIKFDNSYARDMGGFYVSWQGDVAPDPKFLKLNRGLAHDLDLDVDALTPAMLTGSETPRGAEPLAMAYAGHQFGGYSPQLGDGRALLLGEVLDQNGQRQDIHLKGSGKTPFSRGGDGKALIGPVLREYLIGEAMFALGVPTTRALAAVSTGQTVMREAPEAGAVLARVASSHLRVGTFQFFATRGEGARVRQLADYAIARHDPDIADAPDKYLKFLTRVRDRQATLIAHWTTLGFVHGVMNTDNMTISGQTIDYGPCAFLDTYDPAMVFSSIDHQGRYAFGNQPAIGVWNLARLAETLLELINPADIDDAIAQATNEIAGFQTIYEAAWLKRMRAKLGLFREMEGDLALAQDLFKAMQGQSVDFTNLFASMVGAAQGSPEDVRAQFADPTVFDVWFERYTKRLEAERDSDGSLNLMQTSNPIYIPRNHLVEEALQAASQGDMIPYDRLLDRVTNPYERVSGAEAYTKPAPDSFGQYVTYCGT